MDIQSILTTTAGVVFVLGFLPYIISIVWGDGKPSKATWITWLVLDSILLVGMYTEDSVNGQIIGATIGAFIIIVLALKYGTPGFTPLEKWCLAGGAIGITLWLTFDAAILGILMSNAVIFIGAVPTMKSAWKNPKNENKVAWTFFWVSCLFALAAIEEWTLAEIAQPVNFTIIETIMMYLLYVRKPKATVSA